MLYQLDFVDYEDTHYFSKLVLDYLDQAPFLRPFYSHFPNIEGIQKSIDSKKKDTIDRAVLVSVIKQQYSSVSLTPAQQGNLEYLLKDHCFTICTAHQPNLLTGPLYFIYKIAHCIKLANHLNGLLPANKFVPVFYMGSEDADLEELSHWTVNDKKYTWQTHQTGAVGRMVVDDALLSLIDDMAGQIEVLPLGGSLMQQIRACYRKNQTIQQATLEFINTLFGLHGLLVLIPDNVVLKRQFKEVIKQELASSFSSIALKNTIDQLSPFYKVQTAGRDVNLFYLINNRRERITQTANGFAVAALQLSFTTEQIFDEVDNHPERFSPNVVLRPVFQESVLPNVVFIGGGGEIAYWLELKAVFEQCNRPFPVLLLRNSLMLINSATAEKIKKTKLKINDIFLDTSDLIKKYLTELDSKKFTLVSEKKILTDFYLALQSNVHRLDATLAEHVTALSKKALGKIESLENKMLRAYKKQHAIEVGFIEKIKANLFPQQNLQERIENFSAHYAQHQQKFIDAIIENSDPLNCGFSVLTVQNNE